MSEEQPSSWHRRFAVDANNRAWVLAEQTDLSREESTEMLYAAYTSAYHWSKIGSEEQFARAQLLLGQVHARLGHGELAMKFAVQAFQSITSRATAPWEIAFAHAVLANAAATSGDWPLHARHYETAKALGDNLADPEDRQIFFKTFDLIPNTRNY